mgnify:CR=1 FL=1
MAQTVGQSIAKIYKGVEMEHTVFISDENALVKFLNQNEIPATPSGNAPLGYLHWWKVENVERLTDVAILDGHFFLAVTSQGFSLYAYNALNDWYNFIRQWEKNISEDEFLQDLKAIIFSR